VLFETWARRAGHPIYDTSFADPADMQAQLRFHYLDAATRYIPEFSTAADRDAVSVAPVGDAWERHLAGGEPPRLHASDDYHAGPAGQYLAALVLYSTLFARRADGMPALLGLDEPTALGLQRTADAVTGARGWGAPRGAPLAIDDASTLRVDFGPTPASGWSPLPMTVGTIGPLTSTAGARTSAMVTAWAFAGTQEGGLDDLIGLGPEVSRDSLWVGSFDGHAAALAREARVVIRGLPSGAYRLELFASRAGTDEGRGRLTRYRVEGAFADLEVADNRERTAALEDVRPDARGEVVLRVSVSPAGLARFAYLGALRVVRVGP
jgi:hypothetical protein